MNKTLFLTLLLALALSACAPAPTPAASAAVTGTETLLPVSPVAPTPPASPTVAGKETLTPVSLVWETTGHAQPFKGPTGLAVDPSGNLYVIDAGNRRIQKLDGNGNLLLMWGSGGSGDGQFNFIKEWIAGVAVDSAGNVYVTDAGNYRVQKFDSAGKFLAKWGTEGSADGQFEEPGGIAVDAAGNVYVVDSRNYSIQKFDSNGNFLLKWGSQGKGAGQFDFSRDLTSSMLAVDRQGLILEGDVMNGRIQKFDSSGKFISQISMQPFQNKFLGPSSLAVDQDGNIYFIENSYDYVVKMDGNGKYLAVWGGTGSGDGLFMHPYGVAVDPQGYVYASDSGTNYIQKFKLP